jgi:hypothetical protein
MKEYLQQQLNIFEKSDVAPNEHWNHALIVFSAWFFSSFLFVLWANAYYPDAKMYHSAINEGIGPNLWNVIGSFGIFSFGAAIVFCNSKWAPLVAEKILSNTFAIGCLTLGLLTAQWLTLIKNSEMIWWKTGLFGITSGFLIIVVCIYNLGIWYMGYLVQSRDNHPSKFIIKMRRVNLLVRILIAFIICSVVAVLFLNPQ